MPKWIALVLGLGIIGALAYVSFSNKSEMSVLETPAPIPSATPAASQEPSPSVPEPVFMPTPTPVTPSVKPSPVVVPPTPPAPISVTIKTVTEAEVATHNNVSSCYTIMGDKVYDVTDFINKHRGGSDKIIGLCGKDGTAQFLKQHGSSAKAQAVLSSFYIAELAS